MNKESNIVSEILRLELEITIAVNNGHVPSDMDIYQKKRNKIINLRKKIKIYE